VDNDWDDQGYDVSQNILETEAYVSSNRSTPTGLRELMAKPAKLANIMAHSDGAKAGLKYNIYVPSNDTSSPEIPAIGTNSFLNGMDIKSKFVNLFMCHSADFAVPNNVISSVMLNPQSEVVSALGNSTSGGLHTFSGYQFFKTLGMGHSVAESYLKFTEHLQYGGSSSIANGYGGLATYNGDKWSLGAILYGDAYYRP
jgi:hypothetical protein